MLGLLEALEVPQGQEAVIAHPDDNIMTDCLQHVEEGEKVVRYVSGDCVGVEKAAIESEDGGYAGKKDDHIQCKQQHKVPAGEDELAEHLSVCFSVVCMTPIRCCPLRIV